MKFLDENMNILQQEEIENHRNAGIPETIIKDYVKTVESTIKFVEMKC